MVWSAQLGVRNSRRPKLLAETVRNQLIASLKKGIDKHIAAEQFQVSVQTITTTLRTEVGLHNSWQQARFVKAQKNARTLWQKAARTLSQPTAKSLRAKEPSVFAWLYRNDREWLTDFANSKLSLAVKTNRTPIDWQHRDVELVARVKQATIHWLDALQGERLTISKLCELVPGLKSKLSSRKRLPLTDEFLRSVTNQLVS
jgi:Tn7-like transposition protein D